MSSIYKGVTFALVSCLAVLLSNYLESTFLKSFNDDFIALITTIFAINVASISIIYTKLKDLTLIEPEKEIDNKVYDKVMEHFSNAKNKLKNGFRTQIILIGLTFLLQILLNSEIIINCWVSVFNTITILIFLYFLDLTYDLGKSIIELFT